PPRQAGHREAVRCSRWAPSRCGPPGGSATEVASERAGQPLVPGPVDMVAGQTSNAKVPRLGLTRNRRVDARIATTMMPPHAPVAELVDAPDSKSCDRSLQHGSFCLNGGSFSAFSLKRAQLTI